MFLDTFWLAISIFFRHQSQLLVIRSFDPFLIGNIDMFGQKSLYFIIYNYWSAVSKYFDHSLNPFLISSLNTFDQQSRYISIKSWYFYQLFDWQSWYVFISTLDSFFMSLNTFWPAVSFFFDKQSRHFLISSLDIFRSADKIYFDQYSKDFDQQSQYFFIYSLETFWSVDFIHLDQ